MMRGAEVPKLALVHDRVLEGNGPAIYVARRDAKTLFIGGRNFTEEDTSRFRWVPLTLALELDDSLNDVVELPPGRCAWRGGSAAAWVFGAIPVGSTYLIRYQARPEPSAAELHESDGAYVNCWVVTDTLESALRLTAENLAEHDWVVVEQLDAGIASPDDHGTNPLFKQAQIDGLVAQFHHFSIEEGDGN